MNINFNLTVDQTKQSIPLKLIPNCRIYSC